jgi:hypothetical protein
MGTTSGSDPKDRLVDLLADLMHVCAGAHISFDTCLATATSHYEAERPDADIAQEQTARIHAERLAEGKGIDARFLPKPT